MCNELLLLLLLPILLILIAFLTMMILNHVCLRRCQSSRCLVGKTVIITGGDSGIGFQIALDMAKRGAKVIVPTINLKFGNKARDQIIAETDNHNIIVKEVNLTDFKSVRNFAQFVNETENRIDILINNAGVPKDGSQPTKDGIRPILQINFLSHFLLSNLLLDKLKSTPNSRIINTASIMAFFGRIQLDRLEKCSDYGTTKKCIVLITREWAKRLKGTTVTAYTVHPGSTNTPIIQKYSKIATPLGYLFYNSRDGAQAILRIALNKNIEHLSGEFFHERFHVTYPTCRDMELAAKLWEKAEQLVQVK